MRTLASAIRLADTIAARKGEPRYVVYENDERFDSTSGPYHVASEFDCETFFDGSPVLYCTKDRP